MELMPHNKKAVEQILEAYKTEKKVIYTSGVGTGKSWVFMAIAEAIGGRILYVIPKHSIVRNMRTYADFTEKQEKNTDFVTYNSFTSLQKGLDLVKGHSLVVIDECHHLGSDRYGRCLVHVMQKTKTVKYLGLTATPVREDGVDVSGYFDKTVEGITNFEAIEEGLMPNIIYRVCFPEKDPDQIKKEYGKDYSPRLTFDNADEILRTAVKTYPRQKWICFFPNVKSMHHYEPMVKRIFSKHRTMELYASLGNLDAVMKTASEDEPVVILSCNILLEGVHLPGIDGIIMFRDVTSLPCFEQMIGRVCSIGKKISPVVIDCSASAWTLMRKLMKANQGAGVSVPADKHSKEIIDIGIAGDDEFDINKLLKFAGNPGLKLTNACDAVEKYKGFGGKTGYPTYEALQKSSDWPIFKACCRMYKMNPPYVYKYMAA